MSAEPSRIAGAPVRSWKPYPAYKDSGVEWLGKVPEHWEILKLKYTDRVIMGQSPSSEDYNDTHSGLPFLQGNAEFGNINPNPKIWCEKANKTASIGDILVSVRAPIGAVNIADQEYGIGRGLCAIRTNKSNNKYLYYLFICLNDELNSIGTGSTYTAISVDEVENIKIPYLELSEQQSIARFLDDRTRKIDSLIEKKQKLIELLKEERAAVINQAVTKGLDPRAPMRDSGVEWLGEVPEKWELRKISRSFNLIGSGATPESGNKKYYENGVIPWINTGGLNDGILEGCDKKITHEAFEKYTALKIYPKSTILIAMYGATIGKVGLLNFEACTNQACCALGKSSFFIEKFVFYWFLANKRNIVNLSFGGGQPNISQEIIKSLKLTCPPIEEQQSIVQFIESELAIIEGAVSKIEKEIALVQEYRTALISEVVTGKIDVRVAI